MKTQLYTRDLFDKLQPEESREQQRSIDVKNNGRLEELLKIYEEFSKPHSYTIRRYFLLEKNLGMRRGYDSEEIGKVAVLLEQYQNQVTFSNTSGLYLSALINTSPNQEFTLYTNNFDHFLHNLGYRLRENKKLVINGDIGVIGEEMKGGDIIIYGNAKDKVGKKMKDGSIIIYGNAQFPGVGQDMKGGHIVIKGDVNKNIPVGSGMKGGEIIVEGPIKPPLPLLIYKGKITWRGETLFENYE
jgi:hypothetical protein